MEDKCEGCGKVLDSDDTFILSAICCGVCHANLLTDHATLAAQNAALRSALEGRSGKGHFLQSSGRIDCPECHHSAGSPWHTNDCKLGKAALAAKGV